MFFSCRSGTNSTGGQKTDHHQYGHEGIDRNSFPVASVRGMEYRHPTMSTLWGHGDCSKRKKDSALFCDIVEGDTYVKAWV